MAEDVTPTREYVPEPAAGRRFSMHTAVRLSDASPSGLWRLDGVARALQDAATEDWEDCGIVSDALWLARRTSFRAVGRWPVLYDRLKLTRLCAGVGAALAERRTNVYVDDELVIEASSLWVPVDPRGFPVRIPPTFHEIFGEAMNGRRVSGRVPTSEPPANAPRRPWPLRRADLDVIGHVNNAAVWQAVSEVVDAPVREVDVIHHGPVEGGHQAELVGAGDAWWLLVDGEVRVAARVLADVASDGGGQVGAQHDQGEAQGDAHREGLVQSDDAE